MRKLLPLLVLFLAGSTRAQQVSTNSSDYSSSRRMVPMSNLGPTVLDENVQSKFLRQEWSPGMVLLKDGKVLQLPLLFDIYGNKLYFLQDKDIMEFMQSVYEFTITLVKKNDSIVTKFRSFYPPVDKNTNETFYEVLVDGKFQLLRCKAKTIYLYKEQNIPEEERRYSKEILYAVLPDGKMLQIRKDKDYILAQMPDYGSRIQTIVSAHKLKLKNEEGLVQLFEYLNQLD